MSSRNPTQHIGQQIADPSTFIGTAITGRVYSRACLTLQHQHKPQTSTPPTITPPPSLSSPLSITALKFPTRLTSFLIFTSRFNTPYARAFYPIWKNLEKLETVCLNPHLRNKTEEQDEIWKWIESHYAGVFPGDFEEGKTEVMESIVLETMVGEVQVGVLMGVGILRDGTMGIGKKSEGMGGKSNEGMRAGGRERLREWIEEGENFVLELEGLKRTIREGYSEMRYVKEVVRLYGDESVGSECISEGSGTFASAEEDDDVAPPPIPRRSSKRNIPIEGLK